MIRELLVGFGIVEILTPQPVIDACERIGLENPEDAQLRDRAMVLARLEGLFVVRLLVRGRNRAPLSSALFALAGTVAVLAPKPLIRLTQRVAYENTDDLQLKPWVGPAARLLGLCYLLVVFLSEGDDPAPAADPESTD